MAVMSDNDDLIEVVGPSESGGLGEPITGVRAPERVPEWAKPVRPRFSPEQKIGMDDGTLASFFPDAFLTVPKPPVAIDSLFAYNGQLPSELWTRYKLELMREQHRVDQIAREGNLIRRADVAGEGKPVELTCSKCGAHDAALDKVGVCAFGCSS